jgi:DNA-binding beta-propeller fold protein YncE
MHSFSSRAPVLTGTILIAILSVGCSRSPSGTASQRLFMTSPETGILQVYAANAGSDDSPLATIKENPPDKPMDVAIDGLGEAFVANENANVRVYGPTPNGKYELIRNFEGSNTRMRTPSAIAVNRAGSFYIADPANGHGRVEWFSGGANGNLVPDRVLGGPSTGIKDPRGVAIDGSGRLFVADRASNRILVFDANAEGDATPLATIDGLHAPTHLAVDDVLNVYVVDQGDNSIVVLTSAGPENWSPAATITSKSLSNPTGVAVDSAGEIAASAIGGVLFFAPNANGKLDPLRILHGPSPMTPSGVSIYQTGG